MLDKVSMPASVIILLLRWLGIFQLEASQVDVIRIKM